jgi:agmatine deiminase
VIAWPTMRRVDFWRGHLGAARDAYAVVTRAIAEHEPVLVVADEGEGRAAEGWLGDGIEVIELPIDDSWIRDNGPTVLVDDAGERLGVQFGFNGWGRRVVPHDRDAAVGPLLGEHLGIPVERAPLVIEGGAFAGDGAGTLITTEPCVLSDDRNPGLGRDDAEAVLRDWLGAERVIWLAAGLSDDLTGGHVDNVAAFTADPGTVLLQTTTDPDDPDHAIAADNERRLRDAGLEVVVIDVLPHVQCFDEIVEIPYLNFSVTDTAVFVPVGGAAADREIVEQIASHFPGHAAVPVPAAVLAYGGGGVHCITQPVPFGSAP